MIWAAIAVSSASLLLLSLRMFCDGIVVGDGCAYNFGNVVLDLVTDVSHVVGAVIVVAPCRGAAAVLDVCVVGLDSRLKVVFGPCVVSLGGRGFLFPFHHLGLIEHVGVVNLL